MSCLEGSEKERTKIYSPRRPQSLQEIEPSEPQARLPLPPLPRPPHPRPARRRSKKKPRGSQLRLSPTTFAIPGQFETFMQI